MNGLYLAFHRAVGNAILSFDIMVEVGKGSFNLVRCERRVAEMSVLSWCDWVQVASDSSTVLHVAPCRIEGVGSQNGTSLEIM